MAEVYRVGNHNARHAYRPGGSWQLTIVREGVEPPDADGKRSDDTLIGVVVNPIPGLTREETTDYICALLSGQLGLADA